MATTIKIYKNKRNPHKRLEVHTDSSYHNSVRQYLKWKSTGVKNMTGDGSLHRIRKGNLVELLKDYKECE